METDDGPLLASAIATTLVGRRANNVVSQGMFGAMDPIQ